MKVNINILRDVITINQLYSINTHLCDHNYYFLIDYVSWLTWPYYVQRYTPAFIEMLIEKDEKHLIEYIRYDNCSLSTIEKYMSSEYMDIFKLIDAKCLEFTPEFIDKYIKECHLEYYHERLVEDIEIENLLLK